MARTLEGHLDAKGLRFSLVVSRFNSVVAERLLEGALDCLKRHGGDEENLEVVRVPGSWELPLVVKRVATDHRADAIVALGAIIRGETPHFDYVAAECTKGLAQVALKAQIPVALGVLTCDSLEQALDRAGGKAGNKGWDAALAAIEMARLLKALG